MGPNPLFWKQCMKCFSKRKKLKQNCDIRGLWSDNKWKTQVIECVVLKVSLTWTEINILPRCGFPWWHVCCFFLIQHNCCGRFLRHYDIMTFFRHYYKDGKPNGLTFDLKDFVTKQKLLKQKPLLHIIVKPVEPVCVSRWISSCLLIFSV